MEDVAELFFSFVRIRRCIRCVVKFLLLFFLDEKPVTSLNDNKKRNAQKRDCLGQIPIEKSSP